MKLALVDWEGKERPIRMRPEAIDSADKAWLIRYPLNGASAWDGNVAVASYGATRIRIDFDENLLDNRKPAAPKRPLTVREKVDNMRDANPFVTDLLQRFDLRPDE